MKAVRFHEYGDSSVLRYEDVEQPVPGAGQVLIRVAATSFNGVDGNIRAGFMQGPIPVTLPHTPGIDVSGTVAALGAGVGGFEIGDRVVGFLPMTGDGAAAQYVVAPAEILVPAPAGVPLADAAALPVVGLTAWQALFDTPKLTAYAASTCSSAATRNSCHTSWSWSTAANCGSRSPGGCRWPNWRPCTPTPPPANCPAARSSSSHQTPDSHSTDLRRRRPR